MRGEGAEQSRVRGYRRQDASEDTGQTSRQAGTRRMRGSSAALEAGLNHGGEKGSVPALKAVINHGFARASRGSAMLQEGFNHGGGETSSALETIFNRGCGKASRGLEAGFNRGAEGLVNK